MSMDWIVTLWFEKMKVKRSKEDKSKYDKFKVMPKKKKRVKYGQYEIHIRSHVHTYEEMIEDIK